jgi:AbrB family looped-hinge helix DNA binding protein
MTYQTTLSSKGQLVIPKKMRDSLHIHLNQTLTLDMNEKKGIITIRPTKDILDLAGTFKPEKVVSALKIRELFEKNYERI